MKKVIDINSQEKDQPQKSGLRLLIILGTLIAAAFVLLLIVGFENFLALFRYRVALFLAIIPLFALFLWCAYKAFGPKNKS